MNIDLEAEKKEILKLQIILILNELTLPLEFFEVISIYKTVYTISNTKTKPFLIK